MKDRDISDNSYFLVVLISLDDADSKSVRCHFENIERFSRTRLPWQPLGKMPFFVNVDCSLLKSGINKVQVSFHMFC